MTAARELVVGGVRLSVQTWELSDGAPILLLHSLGESSTTWAAVAEALATDHRVYALDLRGHGRSARTPNYSLEAMADDVVGVIDHLGLHHVYLVGHSLGGMLGYVVAARRASQLAGLVLEEAPPPLPNDPRREIPPDPGQDLGFDWNALIAIYAQRNDPDPRWWTGLQEIEVPTLVVAGGPTSHVDQQELVRMAGQIARCEVVEIPVGHNVHADATEEFLRTVRRFLTDIEM